MEKKTKKGREGVRERRCKGVKVIEAGRVRERKRKRERGGKREKRGERERR